MTDEITYDEIQQVLEGACDGCKGLFSMHETGCYERCETFQEELKEMRDLKEDKHD